MSPTPVNWTELFFYPVIPRACPVCAIPTPDGNCCEWCTNKRLQQYIRSSAFLSYTWGRSHSPAYAFKTRDHFDEGLRLRILKLFEWMAYSSYVHLSNR